MLLNVGPIFTGSANLVWNKPDPNPDPADSKSLFQFLNLKCYNLSLNFIKKEQFPSNINRNFWDLLKLYTLIMSGVDPLPELTPRMNSRLRRGEQSLLNPPHRPYRRQGTYTTKEYLKNQQNICLPKCCHEVMKSKFICKLQYSWEFMGLSFLSRNMSMVYPERAWIRNK